MDGDKRSAGFTLVELLVVVVILGILAAVVVFAVGGSTEKAQTSACGAERSSLETAIEAFRASEGSYPTEIDQLKNEPNKYLRSSPQWYQISGTNGDISRTDEGIRKDCPPVNAPAPAP
jgi:type II secretion system protein G